MEDAAVQPSQAMSLLQVEMGLANNPLAEMFVSVVERAIQQVAN